MKILECVALIVIIFTASFVIYIICFKHECEFRAIKTCRWISRCVPKGIWRLALTNIRNSYMCPQLEGTALVKTSHIIFLINSLLSREVQTYLRVSLSVSFQWFSKHNLNFYYVVVGRNW